MAAMVSFKVKGQRWGFKFRMQTCVQEIKESNIFVVGSWEQAESGQSLGRTKANEEWKKEGWKERREKIIYLCSPLFIKPLFFQIRGSSSCPSLKRRRILIKTSLLPARHSYSLGVIHTHTHTLSPTRSLFPSHTNEHSHSQTHFSIIYDNEVPRRRSLHRILPNETHLRHAQTHT